jgi:intracellular septation protein A
LAFNAGLPVASYVLLSDSGVAAAPALAISGVWPAVQLIVTLVRQRRLDELGVLVLLVLGVGVLGALAFNSPRLLLLKDSATTGLFGLTLLVSLLLERPLMFYFGRRFATDGSRASVARWNGLWRHATFRRSQRILTLAWGASFVAEAAFRSALTFVLPTSTMVVINNVLPYTVLAALMAGTVSYGRRVKASAHNRTGPEPLA